MILNSPYNPDKPSKNQGSSDNSDKDSKIKPKNYLDIDIFFVERPPRVLSGVLDKRGALPEPSEFLGTPSFHALWFSSEPSHFFISFSIAF